MSTSSYAMLALLQKFMSKVWKNNTYPSNYFENINKMKRVIIASLVVH